jgi:hypothetical protein
MRLPPLASEPERVVEIEAPVPASDWDALGYLQAIYQGRAEPDAPRMRAAAMALPFERPKLAVIAQIGPGFAERMEAKLRERRLRVIGAKPAELSPAKPMATSIPDRRLRRF